MFAWKDTGCRRYPSDRACTISVQNKSGRKRLKNKSTYGHVLVSRISQQVATMYSSNTISSARVSRNRKIQSKDSTAPSVFQNAIFASFFRADFLASSQRAGRTLNLRLPLSGLSLQHTRRVCIQTPACVALTRLKNVPKRLSTWQIQTTFASHTPACWNPCEIGQRYSSSSIRSSHNSQPSHPPTAVTATNQQRTTR